MHYKVNRFLIDPLEIYILYSILYFFCNIKHLIQLTIVSKNVKL